MMRVLLGLTVEVEGGELEVSVWVAVRGDGGGLVGVVGWRRHRVGQEAVQVLGVSLVVIGVVDGVDVMGVADAIWNGGVAV